MMTSHEIADFSVNAILEDLNPRNPVLLLVNGMGATPLLELYGFHAEVNRVLTERGCPWHARWSGTTSPRWTWRAPR